MSAKPPSSLTGYLLSSASSPPTAAAFKTATQAPFLLHAGRGTLSKRTLSQWLAQDRLYAQQYIRFASLLLANVPLAPQVSPGSLNEDLVDCLLDSLTNVRRELRFFEEVAARYGLDIAAGEVGEGVRRYGELFFGVAEEVERGERALLEGIVVLWATEKCYLEAWRYAASFLSQASKSPEDHADGGALSKEFIPNWTSDEFAKFVDKLGWFVDELWKLQLEEGGASNEEVLRERWMELLDVERVFWPAVQE